MKLRNHIQIWGAAAALGLSLTATALLAQTSTTSSSGTAGTSGANTSLSQAERAAQLFGRQAMSSDNQKIGKVDDLIVDLESGHILYGVINTSKGKVGVPPQIFGQSTDKTVQLNADIQ